MNAYSSDSSVKMFTSTLGWATGRDQRKRPSLSMSPLSSRVSQTAATWHYVSVIINIMEHIERIISWQDNVMRDRSVTKLTQLKIKIYT